MKKKKDKKVKKDLPGYPEYPETEDIFRRGLIADNLDPNDPTNKKSQNMDPESMNEKSFEDDLSGDDLDIPGSELDDEEESVGSEDEENNYYSLGGDNHNDLEEDKG